MKFFLSFVSEAMGVAVIGYMAVCAYWLLFCYLATDQEFNATLYPPPAYVQAAFNAADSLYHLIF